MLKAKRITATSDELFQKVMDLYAKFGGKVISENLFVKIVII